MFCQGADEVDTIAIAINYGACPGPRASFVMVLTVCTMAIHEADPWQIGSHA